MICFLAGHMQLEAELQLHVPTCHILNTSRWDEGMLSNVRPKILAIDCIRCKRWSEHLLDILQKIYVGLFE